MNVTFRKIHDVYLKVNSRRNNQENSSLVKKPENYSVHNSKMSKNEIMPLSRPKQKVQPKVRKLHVNKISHEPSVMDIGQDEESQGNDWIESGQPNPPQIIVVPNARSKYSKKKMKIAPESQSHSTIRKKQKRVQNFPIPIKRSSSEIFTSFVSTATRNHAPVDRRDQSKSNPLFLV